MGGKLEWSKAYNENVQKEHFNVLLKELKICENCLRIINTKIYSINTYLTNNRSILLILIANLRHLSKDIMSFLKKRKIVGTATDND